MPEAVFKIVGAGSKIPPRFKLLNSMETLIVEGPWIGVAICVLIVADHLDDYMDTKYVVTIHIHVGELHRKIPIPITFLARLENQLVFYWTMDGELQRIYNSRKSTFNFSFTVVRGDGYLKVSRFGVRIIRDEDVRRLKWLEVSTNEVVANMFRYTLYLPTNLGAYIHACKADKVLHFFQSNIGLEMKRVILGKRKWQAYKDLHSFHLNIDDLTSMMISFILNDKKRKHSLVGIQRVIKCLVEINQEVLSECKKELMHSQFFTLVYHYHRICHGTSELYNFFVRLLKDISDSWLSVKLALEQVVMKSRAEDCTSIEMLQLVDDLEPIKHISFSESFAYICKQTVDFSSYINEEIQVNQNLSSLEVLAKVSSITIAVVISIVAVFSGDSKLLKEMKGITSFSSWLRLMDRFSTKTDKWLDVRPNYIKPKSYMKFWISECCDNEDLLHELKKKMIGSHVTKENEVMMKIIKKLEMKIDKFCTTIKDMSSHAHEYSIHVKRMGISLDKFGNVESGVCVERVHHSKKHEDSVWKMIRILMGNLYEATASFRSHHLILHNHISIMIVLSLHDEKHNLLEGIHKILGCLHGINQQAHTILRQEPRYKELEFLVRDYRQITYSTFRVYVDFVDLLYWYWQKVQLVLAKIMVERRVSGNYSYEEMAQKVKDVTAKTDVRMRYNDYLRSFVYIRRQTIRFLRSFNELGLEVQSNESMEVLGEVSRATIICIYSFMAACMGDCELMELLKDANSNSKLLDLIERKSDEWFKKASEGEELLLWGLVLLELKKKMGFRHGFSAVDMEQKMESYKYDFSYSLKGICIAAKRYIDSFYRFT